MFVEKDDYYDYKNFWLLLTE